MKFIFIGVLLVLNFRVISQSNKKQSPPIYFPDKVWLRQAPENSGVNSAKLQEAIDYAVQHESTNPRNLEENHYRTFGKEPFGQPIGPIKERGNPTGMIIRHGYIIASWGDPDRIDMTHSVTKSFVSMVAGLAYDKGILSIQDSVFKVIPPIQVYSPFFDQANQANHLGESQLLTPFETPHNRTITWDHLLRQTSDWEGTLWGKPEWADRPDENPSTWLTRTRKKPGSYYEYNDVRVNVLSLALLSVWRKPLPRVLDEGIMKPIGASSTWRWYGYQNSLIVMDGSIAQSVSGGGHWGGGMFINAYDMARFGYLTLHRGRWKDQQLISEQWIKWSLTPTPVKPTYGFMNWYLNTDQKYLPSAPAAAFAHIGNGTNMIYVDPENDIVAVVRWIDNDALDGFVGKLLTAIER